MTNAKPAVMDADRLASDLSEGVVAVIPTDTVVGLAVTPARALNIWSLKRRPAHKPLILMGASTEALLEHVLRVCHSDARAVAERFWPGALTLVLPSDGRVQDALNPGVRTLGVRVPACPLSLNLLERSGPLATSSANPSGEPAATTALMAARYFPDLPQLGPQPWPQPSGQASTVITWDGPGQWRVLRRGALMPIPLEPLD